MTIYSRADLEPMDDFLWGLFDRHQREQLRLETERCARADREKHLNSPLFQAQLQQAIQKRREFDGMYLTTAMHGARD